MAHLKTRKLIRKFANLKNWMNYGCILLIEEANVVRLEINYHICYIRWIILNKFSDSCFRDFLKSANTFTYWSSVLVSGRNEPSTEDNLCLSAGIVVEQLPRDILRHERRVVHLLLALPVPVGRVGVQCGRCSVTDASSCNETCSKLL